jgi:hypothetical protein
MKLRTVVPAIAFLLLAGFPVWAKKNSKLFYMGVVATMNGAEIPVGIYDLRWESEKPGVRVTLWKNGQFFATAKGDWVKHGVKYASDAAVLRVNPDGSHSLIEIRFAGINKTIVLGDVEPIVKIGAKKTTMNPPA